MARRNETTYLNLIDMERVSVEVWQPESAPGVCLNATAPYCDTIRLGLPYKEAAKLAEQILAITGPSANYRKVRQTAKTKAAQE